jgi:hypothetical protein
LWTTVAVHGRRDEALADDGGALVEVGGGRDFAENGGALVEDGVVVEGAATLGEDGEGAPVRNFCSMTTSFRVASGLRKFSECGCYI